MVLIDAYQRRTRVATLFPNAASLHRLASAGLSEISIDWETNVPTCPWKPGDPTLKNVIYRKGVALSWPRLCSSRRLPQIHYTYPVPLDNNVAVAWPNRNHGSVTFVFTNSQRNRSDRICFPHGKAIALFQLNNKALWLDVHSKVMASVIVNQELTCI